MGMTIADASTAIEELDVIKKNNQRYSNYNVLLGFINVGLLILNVVIFPGTLIFAILIFVVFLAIVTNGICIIRNGMKLKKMLKEIDSQ